MIDGAAWLKQLQEQPQSAILLPHDEAVELARTLASFQATPEGERRKAAATAG